eukprot:9968022-Lingulodinium_polyedra.AAC.1
MYLRALLGVQAPPGATTPLPHGDRNGNAALPRSTAATQLRTQQRYGLAAAAHAPTPYVFRVHVYRWIWVHVRMRTRARAH